MSDFATGSALIPVGFQAFVNETGGISILLTFRVITPSGAEYTAPPFTWEPIGKWTPTGDMQHDLGLLQMGAIAAAKATTGLN